MWLSWGEGVPQLGQSAQRRMGVHCLCPEVLTCTQNPPPPPFCGEAVCANLATDKPGAVASTLNLLGLALLWMLSQTYPLLPRPEMLWPIVSLFLPRIPLVTLTHSSGFQSGDSFTVGFVGAASLYSFALTGKNRYDNVWDMSDNVSVSDTMEGLCWSVVGPYYNSFSIAWAPVLGVYCNQTEPTSWTK